MRTQHGVMTWWLAVGLGVTALGLTGCKPDLYVGIQAPAEVMEGDMLPVTVMVTNTGQAAALGTLDAGNKGYMIDLIVSRDTKYAGGWAVLPQPYTFQEDMLLEGGRISHTRTIPAPGGDYYVLTGALRIAAGTVPTGSLMTTVFVGAVVDPGDQVSELDEGNNVSFRSIIVSLP
ncbi:MAG: hypothetical protein KJ726_06355 [Verrucomicrobia bacterium]|nr:hypothetical protein [Verrucomicrobiota bacterium]MBU1909648.1 hypothetical protein [Verrucomicrobiota bacterium]